MSMESSSDGVGGDLFKPSATYQKNLTSRMSMESNSDSATAGNDLLFPPATDQYNLKPAPDPTTSHSSYEAAGSTDAAAIQSSSAAAGANSSDGDKPNKRPLMTHTKDGKLLSEKKLRRLEKNRLSARECRRRKREATENLLHQINVIEGENLQLRLQLQIGQEAESCISAEQSKVTQDIDNLLQSGASEADIHQTLEEFKEKYADYGKSRRSSIEFHLRQIERLLMPTQTTSVVMHAIQGGQLEASNDADETTPATACSSSPVPTADSLLSGAVAGGEGVQQAVSPATSAGSVASLLSQDDSSSSILLQPPRTDDEHVANTRRLEPKPLFQYLVKYLEVTPQQAAALQDSRLVAQELDGCLESALAVLAELRQRLAQTGEDLETEFNNVRNILTPTQAAKFLVWVANNDACMHMLNELWDRVYPQPRPTAIATTAEDAATDNKTL